MSGAFRKVILTAIFLLATSLTSASAAFVELVLPFDNAIIHSPSALVLYKTSPEFMPKIVNNGFDLPKPIIVGGNDTDLHHLRIKLEEGRNTIFWTDPKTETLMSQLTIYHIPPFSLKHVSDKKAKTFTFHQPEFEKRCDTCHPIPEEAETVSGKKMSPAAKACSSCHPDVTNSPRQHEPAATYDCFRCHETNYNPERFAITTSQVALCSYCHQNFLSRLMGENKYVHGPAASGSCFICHNPHGGEGKGILREDPTTLCLHCHSDTVNRELDNLLHDGLDCRMCHTPHASNNRALIIARVPDLCLSCHKDPSLELGGHPMMGHPQGATNDPSKPGREMTCISCHNVHGQPDISQGDLLDDTEIQRTFCLKCHYT
jgi:predicted CXXCH cytochrome family protein